MHDAIPLSPRPAPSPGAKPDAQRAEDTPDPETRALLDALNRDPSRLRRLGDGGPDWARLRARAFRVMVV